VAGEAIRARWAGDSVIVDDPDAARRLFEDGFYGRFLGIEKVKQRDLPRIRAPLILSLFEALYLVEKGVLKVFEDGSELGAEEIRRRASSLIDGFEDMYRIYRYLRDLGYVVKSGLKFGALFSVYERGPGIDHAPIVVLYVRPDEKISALDVARGGRLSHSVRKYFVVSTVLKPENEVLLIGFEWVKP